MTLKEYRVRLANGVETTMQLDEDDVRRHGLTDADLVQPPAKASEPRNKARKPRNKEA